MKIDVDAILKDVNRDRASRRLLEGDPATRRARRLRDLELRVSIPFAPELEGRLLAAILSDRAVLDLCDRVEVDDFGELRHNAVFRALRQLQARGAWQAESFGASVTAIGDELAQMDVRDEKHQRDSVDDVFLAELIGRHMWETYGPPGAPIAAWVEHDARSLRALAEGRRAL